MKVYFVLLICVSLTTVASSDHSAVYNGTECPPWMVASDSGCTCGDSILFTNEVLICERKTNTVYVVAGNCVSLMKYGSKMIGVVGGCSYVPAKRTPRPYKYYSPLPHSVSLKNSTNIMCDIYHRQGVLCSSCKPGYGVSPYAKHFSCAKCEGRNYGILWYLLLEYVPVTVLYIIVVLFSVRATAAPLVGLVFFSQSVLNVIMGRTSLYTSLAYSSPWYTRVLLQIGLFMCSIWNLDFFCFNVPAFCISTRFTNVHSVALEYVAPLYSIFLVLVTYFLVRMYARNVRVIVWLYKPFHVCCVRIRRVWDRERSIINAFSTFLILSYTRINLASFKFLYQTGLYDISHGVKVKTALYISPNLLYLGEENLPFTILAVVVMALSLFLIILLALYPIKIFQKLIRCCRCRAIHGVDVFIDTYQGCLKNGTNGTRDYRAVSAGYLALRLFTPIFYRQSVSVIQNGLILIISAVVLMLLSLLIGTIKPYRRNYMNYSESGLFFLTGLFLMLAYICLLYPNPGDAVATLLAVTILAPHITLIAIIFFRNKVIKTLVIMMRKCCRKVKRSSSLVVSIQDNAAFN